MQQTIHHSPTALAYAQSLLELAEEQNQTDTVDQELAQLREVLEQNPTFVAYLADPGISHEDRSKVLRDTFANQLSPLLWNFIGVLNLKGRLQLLKQISLAFDDLLDEKHGKIEVDVTVASKLSNEQLEEVRQSVSRALKKDAVVHQYVDESIIGGLVLKVQDKMIDASVRSQLQSLRQQLLANRPKA